MKGLNEFAQQIHADNVARGFWETKRQIPELLMLVVSELSEALEADRKNHFATDEDLSEAVNADTDDAEHFVFVTKIKNTFQDEIADAIIRLLDLSAGMGIDIENHIKAKLAYNRTRPNKHGKKY